MAGFAEGPPWFEPYSLSTTSFAAFAGASSADQLKKFFPGSARRGFLSSNNFLCNPAIRVVRADLIRGPYLPFGGPRSSLKVEGAPATGAGTSAFKAAVFSVAASVRVPGTKGLFLALAIYGLSVS